MSVDIQFSRREVIARSRAMLAEGLSQKAAAGELGVSEPTLSRWLAAYERGGTADLAPRYKGRCGRKKLTAKASADDRLGLQLLKLRTGSDRLALDLWADDARCSPALRAAILRPRQSKHNLPDSLRQLCAITPEVAALAKGEKRFQLNSFVQLRDDSVVLHDGTRRALEAGDLFELDDMSLNQPFWWELDDAAAEHRLAQRQGAAVGRQVLFCRDVKSGQWKGHELIGRPRDAYRAADILRFLRQIFESCGIPRLGLRLERGIWKSKAIAGVHLAGECRPEMEEAERQKLFGGLQELGCPIEWCHSPNHKGGLEGAFNHLQRVMSATAVREGAPVVDLGRTRGEFEHGTKMLMAAHAGRKHPRELGFWSIDEAATAIERACAWINARDYKEGRIEQGIADQVWQAAVARDPLRSLAKEKLWVFLPHEALVGVRNGHLECKVADILHLFCAPTLFADLGNGYPLRVRFDATEPSLGAWVFNHCPRDDRRNLAGHAPGAYLGWAECMEFAPQFDLAHGFDGRHRKRYLARVRANFRAIGHFGRPAAAVAQDRDGGGGVTRIERLKAEGLKAEAAPAEGALVNRARPVAVPPADVADLDAIERKLRERGALIG